MAAFSQNKEELILQFANNEADFTIRANLHGELTGLSFPSDFARKGRNSVDLFQEFLDLRILRIEMVPFDRSFIIHFEEGKSLLFKMHGRRSNLLGIENGKVITLFKNSMEADNEITIESLAGNVDLEAAAQSEDIQSLKKAIPVLDNTLAKYIINDNWQELSLVDRSKSLEDFFQSMSSKNEFFIEQINDKITLGFWPQTADYNKFTDVIEALNFYNQKTMSVGGLRQQKKSLLGDIQKKIKSGLSYIQKNEIRLNSLKDDIVPEEIGHIIMANLHMIKKGEKEVTLDDFYRNQPITIKLKPDLSPQKNAEYYYRKSKNRKIEIAKLEENILLKQSQIEDWKKREEEIANAEAMRGLKAFTKEKSAEAKIEIKPYKEFEIDGYQVWVGKNSKSNDELTQKYAHKDDIWLHARGVAGSHVIIKKQGNKPVPLQVIEKAAGLAAYYSKAKSDTLCPVIYTSRKYIRKPKGSAPGQVMVDREEVLIVPPASPHN
ncbi:NFACT RNA binding domain-containing protein [Peijinzhouia sedimentorum]